MLIAILAALGAAMLFAVSNALQHRSATDIPRLASLGRRDLARFTRHTVRHAAWLAGTAADTVGFGLHALALHAGPLTLVQPLLVTAVIFALPLRQAIDGRRPAGRELLWAAVLAGALAAFLAVVSSASGSGSGADRVPAVVAVVAVPTATVLLVWWGRRSAPGVAATVLGCAAGLTFAALAALTKAATTVFARDPLAIFGSWTLYALLAAGAVGLLLNQMAFQAGPLRASLPAIATADPLASLVIGVAVYDEKLRTGLPAVTLEATSLLLVCWAVITLSRGPNLERGSPGKAAPSRRFWSA